MGRLSSWSMAEFARFLLGEGIPDADSLLLRDASGSKSHRAGLAVVSGQDAAYYGWPETKDQVDDLEALGERLLRQMAERMPDHPDVTRRSEEHTSELTSLMRISYAVFCLKNNTPK